MKTRQQRAQKLHPLAAIPRGTGHRVEAADRPPSRWSKGVRPDKARAGLHVWTFVLKNGSMAAIAPYG
jgi:hypothetical protein